MLTHVGLDPHIFSFIWKNDDPYLYLGDISQKNTHVYFGNIFHGNPGPSVQISMKNSIVVATVEFQNVLYSHQIVKFVIGNVATQVPRKVYDNAGKHYKFITNFNDKNPDYLMDKGNTPDYTRSSLMQISLKSIQLFGMIETHTSSGDLLLTESQNDNEWVVGGPFLKHYTTIIDSGKDEMQIIEREKQVKETFVHPRR